MRKVLLLALGLFLFFGTAGAVDKKGKIGAGFFNDDAPVGARYWVTDRFGFDLGFGLNWRNVVDSTEDSNWQTAPGSQTALRLEPTRKNLIDFRFDAGLPVNLVRTEKVNFLIRPGFSFQRTPYLNSIFRDSVRVIKFVDSVYTLPGDTTFTLRFDSAEVPIGSVLDTVREERSKAIDINLNLGIEYFPVENFSVSLFHGVGLRSEKRTKDGKSFWAVTSRPFFRGTNLGFRYYF